MRILGLLIFLISSLDAGVADHLKKAVGKDPQVNKIKNIDLIYMINLDSRPDKFQKCISQLHPYGISPYRFSAVNGWELDLEQINDVGVKYTPGTMKGGFVATSYLTPDGASEDSCINTPGQTYFVLGFTRGMIGICLSHLSVLQDAYDSGYETIWVMEDNIEVIRDPRIISDVIDRLDQQVGVGNWDILFTDRDFRNQKLEYVRSTGYALRPNYRPQNPARFTEEREFDWFRKVGARFGATSMIIRRSGIEKILSFLKTYQLFLPYDIELAAHSDMRLYTVKDDIISNLLNDVGI